MNTKTDAEKGAEDDAFEVMKVLLIDKVETWEDMYSVLAAAVDDAMSSFNPPNAAHAIFLLYAFVAALRDNPDEGDIRKLALYMADTIARHSRERLGHELSLHTGASLRLMQSIAAATAALAAVPPASGDEAAEVDVPATYHKQGKTLH